MGLVREMHKEGLKLIGYSGYDDEIDNEYHHNGMYFIVVKDEMVVMTSRVNERSRRFPFEMGELVTGGHYEYGEIGTSVDINTYSLIAEFRLEAMPLILASIGLLFGRP